MNLKGLLGRARVSKLGFGVHERIYLTSVADKPKKGMKLDTHIARTVLHKWGATKAIGMYELAWFKPNPTRETVVLDTITLIAQTLTVVRVCGSDEARAGLVEKINAMIGFVEGDQVDALKRFNEFCTDKESIKKFVEEYPKMYKEALAPFIVADKPSEENFKYLKLITNGKTTHVNIPRYKQFISSVEGELEITQYDTDNFDKSNMAQMTTIEDNFSTAGNADIDDM